MQPSELVFVALFPPHPDNTTTTVARALMRRQSDGWYDPGGQRVLRTDQHGG